MFAAALLIGTSISIHGPQVLLEGKGTKWATHQLMKLHASYREKLREEANAMGS